MKYLKLYENIDWDFDDEEYQDNKSINIDELEIGYNIIKVDMVMDWEYYKKLYENLPGKEYLSANLNPVYNNHMRINYMEKGDTYFYLSIRIFGREVKGRTFFIYNGLTYAYDWEHAGRNKEDVENIMRYGNDWKDEIRKNNESFDFEEDIEEEDPHAEIKRGDKFYIDIDRLYKKYDWSSYFNQKDKIYIATSTSTHRTSYGKLKCVNIYGGYYVPHEICHKVNKSNENFDFEEDFEEDWNGEDLEYGELCKEIDRLDDIVNKKINIYDSEYWRGYNGIPDWDEYNKGRNAACQPELSKLNKLLIKKKRIMPYKLSVIPSFGDIMSLEDFLDNVKSGGFIDYDGWGNYIKDNKMTDIEIRPSDVKKDCIRNEFDKIVWFNR